MSILLKNCYIVTQNKKRKNIFGDILIENGKIKKIGELDKSDADKVIDVNGSIVLPAFINTHMHLGETIFKGFCKKMNLKEYIKFTENINKKIKNKKFVRHATVKFSLLELIKNGVSTFCAARSWRQVKNSGLRAFLGYPFMKSKKLRNYCYSLNSFDKLYEKYSEKMIKFGIWIHSLSYVDSKILDFISEKFRERKDIFLTIHVGEMSSERKEIYLRYKRLPIEVLDDYKLLDNRTILVHCNYLCEDELNIIAKRKAHVSFCPISNILFKNSPPNIMKFIKRKINFSLATDGLLTSNSANLLKVARVASLLWRKILSPQKLIDSITVNAAKALNLFDTVGTIEKNKSADLIVFSNSLLKPNNMENIFLNLIYFSPRPSHLIVEGKFIMENGKCSTLDENKIIKDFKRAREIVWGTNFT
jgi:5-methylthioadenosine/S-adenosylhomocysteine deaminase